MQYGWNPERRKNDICKSVCSRRNYLHISTDLFGSYKVNAGKSDGVTRNNRSNPWGGRQGVIEAVKEEGTIGLFKGGLKAAAAGTSSALIFSYLAALIFQPKMKK